MKNGRQFDMVSSAQIPEIDSNLIFDIGFYDGSDSRFYLDKGFRVVAVEAGMRAVGKAREVFSKEIETGALTLIPKAIWNTAGEVVPFFLHPGEGSSWHSVFQEYAERDGATSVIEEVETTTAPELFDTFGVPRYIKCDIEGADEIVADQIRTDGRLPAFASTEFYERSAIELLRDAGYDRFQLVNQGHLSKFRSPRPAREGLFCDSAFESGYSGSGLFGLELPTKGWVDFQTCVMRFEKWKKMKENYGIGPRIYKHIGRLTRRGWLDCSGWMDVHATTSVTLGGTD